MTASVEATARRIGAVQGLLRDSGLDVLFAAPSSDLVYLLGYAAHPSERPMLFAIPRDSEPVVLVAQLEAPRLGYLSDIRVVAYDDTQDPYETLAGAMPSEGVRAAAVSDQAWASVLLRLQQALPGASFQPAGPLLRRLRMIKLDDEVALLQRAGSMADAAFAEIISRPFAGRSEAAVAEELKTILSDTGLDTADWGPIVAGGPNSASPHHMTGDRVIEEGDTVVLDYGGSVQGYQADITRTVHVGEPDSEFVRVYEVVRQAQQAGVDAVRAGQPAQEVDRAARGVIDAAGYGSFFIHRTGHGVGLDVHEEPYYILEGNEAPLQAGMTFSVEPGVYLPERFGVRIEDIVCVTEAGCMRLNNAPRELVIVR